MTTGSFARRYWDSLTGAQPSHGSPHIGPGREGYPFWQRYWASLTDTSLPRRVDDRTASMPGVASAVPWRQRAVSIQPSSSEPGWFSLPPVPDAAPLLAAGDHHVLLEARTPDGSVEFYVHGSGGSAPRYRLEVVLRDPGAVPAVVTVGYGVEPRRHLLIPLVGGGIVPPSALVELPGLRARMPWYVSAPSPIRPDMAWGVDTVSVSVGAAANEFTREAWRRCRALVGADLGRIIDEALA